MVSGLALEDAMDTALRPPKAAAPTRYHDTSRKSDEVDQEVLVILAISLFH
jgi:hypothetical protein